MLPKEVKVRENFLPLDLYQEINQYSKDTIYDRPERNNFSTHHWWQPEIVGDSFPVIIHRLPEEASFYSPVKKFIEDFSGLNADQIFLYYCTTFAYFPWHNDGKRDGALTIYLNDSWDDNWGGYYMFKETEYDIRAIIPKPNLAVLSTGSVWHSTTAVNRNAEIRRSLQVYLGRPKNAQ